VWIRDRSAFVLEFQPPGREPLDEHIDDLIASSSSFASFKLQRERIQLEHGVMRVHDDVSALGLKCGYWVARASRTVVGQAGGCVWSPIIHT